MKIQRGKYYLVIYESSFPRIFGNAFDDGPYQAVTLGPLIFAPGSEGSLTRRVLEHETNHVQWWWLFLGIALALCAIFHQPPVVWVSTVFAFFVVYSIAGFVAVAQGGDWYEDNWFEHRARTDAGEEK